MDARWLGTTDDRINSDEQGLGRVSMGWYPDLDIMQDQDDIRLAASVTEGFPCHSVGWTPGYAETVKLLVRA